MAGHELAAVEAVRQQLAAMNARRYEVGIKRANGHMIPRVLTAGRLLGQVAWLERENRQGADIFIRPEGSMGLILVDDLNGRALGRMASDGLAPAVVVETSPGNHQAWVRVSPTPIEPMLATTTARLLAERYDGDLNSAAWRHYGRQAGFENRKRKHRRGEGTYPLVWLVAATGEAARAGEDLLDAARARLAATPPAPRVRVRAVPVGRHEGGPVSPLGQLYRREVTRLVGRYAAADLSRLDWMIVLSLARAYEDATAEELARAMVEGSPGLDERKAGHVGNYVARTVSKALAMAGRERTA